MKTVSNLRGWTVLIYVDQEPHVVTVIIRSYGIDPFVMVYRDYHTGKMARDPQLRNLARWVNRRLYKTCTFEEYWPEVKRARQRSLPLRVVA